MLEPGIPADEHAKKCVFGVFLNPTRIALVRKNRVIDIVLKNGARGGLEPPTRGFLIETEIYYHLITYI